MVKEIEHWTAVNKVSEKFRCEMDQLKAEYNELNLRHEGYVKENATQIQSMASKIAAEELKNKNFKEQYDKMKSLYK